MKKRELFLSKFCRKEAEKLVKSASNFDECLNRLSNPEGCKQFLIDVVEQQEKIKWAMYIQTLCVTYVLLNCDKAVRFKITKKSKS